MDICYCVFWFPTIFHRRKKSRFRPEEESKIPSVSIADEDSESNLLLEITEEKAENPSFKASAFGEDVCLEDEECYDLIFRLTDQDGKTFDTRFRCKDQTRNGFVVYSYDRAELIDKYWGRFEKEEQKQIIEKVRRIRVVDRIKKKYSTATEPNPDDELIKNYIIDRILISFYHHAKQFYHEHETHSDSDGKYVSYYYTKEHEDGSRDYLREPPLLSTKNNAVINWYIDQFEKQLVGNAINISRYYKNWSKDFKEALDLKRRVEKALTEDNNNEVLFLIGEIQSLNQDPQFEQGGNEPPETLNTEDLGKTIENPNEYLSKLYRDSIASQINSLYDSLDTLSKECTDSLIEYTYCKTLLESKYNDDYKHGSFFSGTDLLKITASPHVNPELLRKDSRRKKAFNIRNSIRYIEDIKQKCDFLGIRITEMLMEEVHGISNENEHILDKIKELTTANNEVLSTVKTLTVANNNVLGNVQELSKANTEVLSKIGSLTASNNSVLTELKSLTDSNNAVLTELNSLTSSNTNVLNEIGTLSAANSKALSEAAKSNEKSSILGWLSFAISFISIGVSMGEDHKVRKWIIIGIAALILIIVGIVKMTKKTDSKTCCTSQTTDRVCNNISHNQT